MYAAYAAALVLVRGAEPFARVRGGLASVVVFYFIAGVGAGAIVGALRPLGEQWYGAMTLGALAALPAGFAVGLLVVSPERWSQDYVLVALIFAFFLGPLCGLGFWYVSRSVGVES